ncbi:MAG: hypothetical protein JWN34_2297 [Bryobacterales bacterium]|jgi:hypothetical protein|nr:hypothetical protein [Bryobacterales bacterium]
MNTIRKSPALAALFIATALAGLDVAAQANVPLTKQEVKSLISSAQTR